MMEMLRKAAPAIIIVLVTLLLVVGAIALSLAQGRIPALAPATLTLSPLPTTARPPTQGPMAQTSTAAATTSAGAATQVVPTSTYFYPTAVVAKPSATARVACGPPIGWVRTYQVQAGDTLYRIATLHGITVLMLQQANCKSGTLIYTGEMLWVPFELPAPTELTIIPTFPTPTDETTPTATGTATATETLTQ